MKAYSKEAGFTLIEVLLALAVIAIALTALLKALAQQVENTHRIKEKITSHWVAMQGVAMIQLNLISPQNLESTQVSTLLGESWYWRIKLKNTPIKKIQQITILTSSKQTGPFFEELVAFRSLPPSPIFFTPKNTGQDERKNGV